MNDAARPTKMRLGILGALWATISIAALAAPGCYGRNCEGSAETLDANTGHMLDDDMWESSPMVGEWIPFPRQRVWIVDVPALGGRTPALVTAYVSASKNPSISGDLTNGAGNLAKLTGPRPNGINVYNDSCSDYFLRLVLQVPPFPPVVSPTDAGETLEVDASTDASVIDASDGG